MMITWTLILLLSLNDNPPGTIKIKNHFVDKTEIQNIHWIEYIYHRSKEIDSVEVHKILPDTLNFWYSKPENRFKPIVLITYDQAIDYCAWRSKVVSKRMGKKITYRLPTKSEWKEIAEEILNTDLKQIEKEINETKILLKKDSTQHILTAIEKPKSRIYNMFNNVSEMTLDKGISMGSNNYELTDLEKNLTRIIKYNSSNIYLGFRCVAVID